jgi:hypothetical protein
MLSDPNINLNNVSAWDTEVFKSKIAYLFKICRIMKENMSTSGTHDSDPWSFVQGAISRARRENERLPLISPQGVYYFYIRCEE